VKHFLLLSLAAMAAVAPGPAVADSQALSRRLDRLQKMIEAQQKQIEDQKKEINRLSHALAGKDAPPEPAAIASAPPAPPPVVETRLKQQDQKIDDLIAKFAAEQDERRTLAKDAARPSVSDGRLEIASADGRFSAALRMTSQYDFGYYMQSARARSLPLGPDLSSGGNFRRAQIGFQGKLFGDWAYSFKMDFGSGGSSGTETPGRLQEAYLEYDGLAPFAFRVGVHSAALGMDEASPSSDLYFLERSGPTELARSLASGSRDSMELLYVSDRFFSSVALTGDKPQETGSFDEQQAVVARAAYLPISSRDWHWAVSVGGSDIFRPADASAAQNSPSSIHLSIVPELVLDDNSTKFVDTGTINGVSGAWDMTLESGINHGPFLAQGGYFRYGVDRNLPGEGDLSFSGWYGEASWVLSGESREWSPSRAAFLNPRSQTALSEGGLGALELVARYSDLNLNDHAGSVGSPLPLGGMRGGEQRITTLGLDWYPNTVVKFMLQAQNVQVSKIGATALAQDGDLGQNFDTLAFRSQIAF
jgi:phosphate-selective porin OprO/OprP